MIYVGLATLSAAVLLLEVTLTRIYSVTQGYHFAFLAVSLGLLGFGASGTALFLLPPGWKQRGQTVVLGGSAVLFGFTTLAAYWAINTIPFDSYRLVIDPAMVGYLVLFYSVQVIPFFFGGLALGASFSMRPSGAGGLYGSALVGSGIGALFGLGWPATSGPVAALSAVIGLSAVAWLAFSFSNSRRLVWTSFIGLILISAGLILPRLVTLEISPYKSLPQILLQQGSTIEKTHWNSFSRIDEVSSGGFHQAPGLSFEYRGSLPRQTALMTDAGNPTMLIAEASSGSTFTEFLPTAIAYSLIESPRVLIIEPGGGIDIVSAVHHGANHVVAVVSNPVEAEILRNSPAMLKAGDVVDVVVSNPRSYLERGGRKFDLVVVSLREAFRPVIAGAYSLSENYIYTEEAFDSYFDVLGPGGVVMATRWIQVPPSEGLRMVATFIHALERSGPGLPHEQLAAIRTLQTLTVLGTNSPFTGEQLNRIRKFVSSRKVDISYLPGLAQEEVNRFFVLPDEIYYSGITEILDPDTRSSYYQRQEFDVSPAIDDRPFFFHSFRWSQLPEVMSRLGKSWEPFGGAGFLVVILFLLIAFVLSAVLILVPLVARRTDTTSDKLMPTSMTRTATLSYFLLLGLGFLWIELPLMQRFILLLDHPTYSFGVVLFSILFFSGLGSIVSPKFGRYRPLAVALLGLTALVYSLSPIPPVDLVLGLPLTYRIVITVVSVAPLAFLMGIPLPSGIAALSARNTDLIPWAWGVNGYASVVGATLAVLISVSWGFSHAMHLAAVCYLLAAWMLMTVLKAHR